MSFKLIWAVLCQESSIDNSTNNIRLFKVLEELNTDINMEELDKLKNDPNFDHAKPIFIPFNSQLVMLWKNESDDESKELPMKIFLKDPDGTVMQEINNVFKFQKGKDRLRLVLNINGFALTKSGYYTYSIMSKQHNTDFEEVFSIPIKVNINLKRNKE